MPIDNAPLPSWESVTSDPAWASTSDHDKAIMARTYARRALRPKVSSGGDPTINEFLSRNLPQSKVDSPNILEQAVGALPALSTAPTQAMAKALLPSSYLNVGDEYKRTEDAGLTAAISRGEAIDPTAIPGGIADAARGTWDAAGDIVANTMNGGLDGAAEGLGGIVQAGAGATVGDPLGMLLGGASSHVAGLGLKSAAARMVSPALKAATPALSGAIGGATYGASIPLAEGRTPTLSDIALPVLGGAALGHGISRLKPKTATNAPPAVEPPDPAGPDIPNDPQPNGPSGPEPQPRWGGAHDVPPPNGAPAEDWTAWKSAYEAEDARQTAAGEARAKQEAYDTAWKKAEQEAQRNQQAEDERNSQQQRRDQSAGDAERARRKQSSDEAQRAYDTARKQSEAGTEARANQKAPSGHYWAGDDEAGGYTSTDQGFGTTDAPPQPYRKPGTPRAPFDFPARIAEVQHQIDNHEVLKNGIEAPMKAAEIRIPKAEAKIRSLSSDPKLAEDWIANAHDHDQSLAKSRAHANGLEEKDAKNAGPIRVAHDNLRGLSATVKAAKARLAEMPAKLKDWHDIMAKLVRGEEGSATPEHALGLSAAPLLGAAKLAHEAYHAAGEMLDKHRDWISALGLGHVQPGNVDAVHPDDRKESLGPEHLADIDRALDKLHAPGVHHNAPGLDPQGDITASRMNEIHANAEIRRDGYSPRTGEEHIPGEPGDPDSSLRESEEYGNRGTNQHQELLDARRAYRYGAPDLRAQAGEYLRDHHGFDDETLGWADEGAMHDPKNQHAGPSNELPDDIGARLSGRDNVDPGPGDLPPGARRGSINVGLLTDIAYEAAKSAGQVIIGGADMARRIQSAINAPAHYLDHAWRQSSLHQQLTDFRETLKYGPSANMLTDGMRRLFVTNYGVPPELLAMAADAELQGRNEPRAFQEWALDMDRNLTPFEQEAMSRQISERPKGMAMRAQSAGRVGDESARLSKMLLDVGALTQKAYERWSKDGYYLPRIYEGKYPVISSFVRAGARILKGNKSRGHDTEMSQNRYNEVSQSWETNSHSVNMKHVTVRNPHTGETRTLARDAKGIHTKEGDYVGDWEHNGYTGPHAAKIEAATDRIDKLEVDRTAAVARGDLGIAAKIQAKIDKTRSVRNTHIYAPETKVSAWRDWTRKERDTHGEIHHASLRMHQLAQNFEKAYATGKLLADIARNTAWAIPESHYPKGTAPPHGFTLFDKKKNTDGTYKWGQLAGHYVRDDVGRYLRWNKDWLLTIQKAKTLTGQNTWKRFMTIDNPGYYLNNIMQNVPYLELAGGSIFDLPQAFKEVAEGSPFYKSLQLAGAVDKGHVAQDLAVSLRRHTSAVGGPLELCVAFHDALKSIETKGAHLSMASDDMFRVALAIARRREGMTDPNLIADSIKGVFYDPGDVTSPIAEGLGAAQIPFAKTFFFTADRLSQLIMDNPAKASMLVGWMNLFMGIAYFASGYNDDKQRRGLDAQMPGYQKNTYIPGTSVILSPGHIPVPGTDGKGQHRIVDSHNWNPLQPVQGDDNSMGYWPRQLIPGGPVMTIAEWLLNTDYFHGKKIQEYSPGGVLIHNDLPEFLRDNLLPSVFGNKGGKVIDAAQGRTDSQGRSYDVPTAVAGMFGLKLQPFDNEQAMSKMNNRYKALKNELHAQLHELSRQLDANPQDEKAIQKKIDNTYDRIDQLNQEHSDQNDKAGEGFPTSELQQLLARPNSGINAKP